ncbi:hypothetical protein TKK_0002167 [Trichogramma kaykai]
MCSYLSTKKKPRSIKDKNRRISWLLPAIAALSLVLLQSRDGLCGRPDYTGLEGPYCSRYFQQHNCCPGRQDECSVPILGTLCYCDDFCRNRSADEDCCPDYYSHCLNEQAFSRPGDLHLGQCYHNGRTYLHGDTLKINCNHCKCSSLNGTSEILCEPSGTSRDRCVMDQEVIDRINILENPGWIARNYSELWGYTLNEAIKRKTGTLNPTLSMCHVHAAPFKRDYDVEDLPEEFDARHKWPGYIASVRDQGWCAASWAISTADVASDRFAIASEGAERVELSAQHLLSCNNRYQRACDGGYVDVAWTFVRKFGLTDEECYPWTGESDKCMLQRRRGTLSELNCRARNSQSYELRDEFYKTGPAFRVRTEHDMMHEIMLYGPVQATMRVYQDFFNYESGIYKHSILSEHYANDYHSVRIIGWGEEPSPFNGSPVKFWRVANSWGREWGEDGYFRILRGTNECEIESFALAVEAKTY